MEAEGPRPFQPLQDLLRSSLFDRSDLDFTVPNGATKMARVPVAPPVGLKRRAGQMRLHRR
jgi:hypothetical protein